MNTKRRLRNIKLLKKELEALTKVRGRPIKNGIYIWSEYQGDETEVYISEYSFWGDENNHIHMDKKEFIQFMEYANKILAEINLGKGISKA